MLKYVDTLVGFAEIPDEITLCINISNCPCHCINCHSSYLADDIGEPLDLQHLTNLIDNNRGITCVCIMGGDANPSEVDDIAQDIKEYYPELKVAWYSGRQELDKEINLEWFDFLKLGPYIEELGPLNSKTTNQRFYKVVNDKLIDITSRFWKQMINIKIKEYGEEDIVTRTITVTLFCIPIFSYKKTSTNRVAVDRFNKPKERVRIKGFNNETKN